MPEGTHPTRMAIAQQFLAHIGHRDREQGIELLSPQSEVIGSPEATDSPEHSLAETRS